MSRDLDAFSNPHFWLASYGIRSEYFCWAVAHGALNDIDPPQPKAEAWKQPALAGMGARGYSAPRPKPRRLYRSRPPVKSDVPAWNRETLKYLPVVHRLRDKYVLR